MSLGPETFSPNRPLLETGWASGESPTKAIVRPFICFCLLTAASLGLVVAFENHRLLPPAVSVALIYLLTGWGLWRIRLSPLSPLTRLMILLYFMPFSITLGYLWNKDFTWWYTPLSLYYMRTPSIIAGMLMVGVIGLVALLSGLCLAKWLRLGLHAWRFPGQGTTLGPIRFGILLALSLFFSYINTPKATIFASAYSAAEGPVAKLNFNAAAVVAYTLLVLLYVDSEQAQNQPLQKLVKRLAVVAGLAVILVFFQLLRGDRDAFGLVVGLGALYLTEPRNASDSSPRPRIGRYVLVGVAGLLVFLAFMAIVTWRQTAARGRLVSIGPALDSSFRETTWTCVLLTNLSLAAQYDQGRMVTEAGRTYRDYVLSLPPGFVTRALGIERPIETYRGPNFWFTDVSSGGLHIVTVPFKNFHSPGVVVALLLFGYIIGRAEVMGQQPNWMTRLLYGAFFVSSAQWFWYGDITFIRGLMAFGVAAGLYVFLRRYAVIRSNRALETIAQQSPRSSGP